MLYVLIAPHIAPVQTHEHRRLCGCCQSGDHVNKVYLLLHSGTHGKHIVSHNVQSVLTSYIDISEENSRRFPEILYLCLVPVVRLP